MAIGAVTVTHLAAAAWMIIEWQHRGKPMVLGIGSGTVADWRPPRREQTISAQEMPLLRASWPAYAPRTELFWKGKIGYEITALTAWESMAWAEFWGPWPSGFLLRKP